MKQTNIEKLIEEIWVDVIGYEGLYKVSSLGNVKSLHRNKELILKIDVHNNGYCYIGLSKLGKLKNKLLHRIVWESFNGASDLDIDHKKEGNKSDNRLENLQTLDRRSNISKSKLNKIKTSIYTGVWLRKGFNKWTGQIQINGKKISIGQFDTELEAYNSYQKLLLNHNQPLPNPPINKQP